VKYYNYSTELPFSKKNLKFREITSKEQIILAKANLSFENSKENHCEFNEFVIQIIKNCLEKPEDFDDINIIDYVLFITKLRIISVGNIIELMTESQNPEFKNAKTTLNLNIFLKNLYESAMEAIIDNVVSENDVEIGLNWPNIKSIKIFQKILLENKSEYEMFSDSFQEFVEYIKIKDKKISFLKFNTEQKIEIIEKLSVSLIKKAQEKVLDALKFIMNYDLWQVSSFKNQNFNFYNLNYTNIIRLFFSNNIKNIFQEIYYMAKEGLPPSYVQEISPIERKIHLNLIEDSKRTENNETSYDFNKINKNSSKELQDLALEFDDTV